MRIKAKANILQGPLVLCADDAAILVLGVHTSDGCEWKDGKKRVKLVEPEHFRVSSYPERDRVDKAPLVFCQLLYGPPLLPYWGPALHPVFYWLL